MKTIYSARLPGTCMRRAHKWETLAPIGGGATEKCAICQLARVSFHPNSPIPQEAVTWVSQQSRGEAKMQDLAQVVAAYRFAEERWANAYSLPHLEKRFLELLEDMLY